jgi:diacylglycerol kinase family enzyme
MARSEASGKTPNDLTKTRTTVALVANERAGSNDAAHSGDRLRSFGAEVLRFGVDETEEAAASGADRLVVAGGDGSIGPAAAAAGKAGIPLAVVPAGTANDFARRMGLPDGITAACRLAVHGTTLKSMELGWMNDERPFVNVASAGLPAPAAERAGSWKGRLGPLAYAAGALSAGVTAKPLTCLVLCNGRELLAGEAWQVTVAASGAFGAGASIEEADPTDGSLEVVAIEAGSRAGLVSLAYHLRRGTLTSHPRAYHLHCDQAEVQVPDCTRFNVDGEVVTVGDARFRAVKGAFRLVVG